MGGEDFCERVVSPSYPSLKEWHSASPNCISGWCWQFGPLIWKIVRLALRSTAPVLHRLMN